MTHGKLLSMQSLLEDIFGPILIESFSLEEIKLENLLSACSQNTFFAFLKAAAENFFARFLIFSFGLWCPLGAQKKIFFFAQIHY